MKKMKKIIYKYRALSAFRRVYWPDLYEQHMNPHEVGVQQDFDRVAKEHNEAVEKIWQGIRAIIMKGHSAGVIAMLTLFGSQIKENAHDQLQNIFLVLMVFLVGLACLLLRPFVEIWHEKIDVRGTYHGMPDGDGGYSPPPVVMTLARALDISATILLAAGICQGLLVLYNISQF